MARYTPVLAQSAAVLLAHTAFCTVAPCIDTATCCRFCCCCLQDFQVFGYARSKMTDEDFREMIASTLTCRIDARYVPAVVVLGEGGGGDRETLAK